MVSNMGLDEIISRKKYLFSIEGLGSLWLSLATTLIETRFLIAKLMTISSTSIILFPNVLSMILAYVSSVVALPLILSWIPGAMKELAKIYRKFAETSCFPFRLPKLKARLALIGIAIPISSLCIVIAVISSNVVLALAGFIPIAIALTIMLTPIYVANEHRKKVEVELPWFATLLDITESVGANIKFVSDRLRKTGLLPSIAKELDSIFRDYKLRSPSYIDSILKRADLTPSPRFARFLRGYAIRIRSGSSVSQWLRMWLLEEFMRSEFSYRLFSERASLMISQVAIGIYIFIPVIMAALGTLTSSIIMLVPILGTPALIMLAYATRPKTLDRIDYRSVALALVACVATSVTSYPWLKYYSALLGWVMAIILCTRPNLQLREVKALQRDSYELLNAVTELRRIGLSIPSALRKIANETKFDKTTRKRLEDVLRLYELGIPLSETIKYVPTPSFMFKFVIFALGVMHESGSKDTSAIQRLLETLRRIDVLEENARKVAMLFDVLAIATMGIVVWIAKTMNSILSSTIKYLPIATSLASSQLALMISIALLGYSLVSTILRTGHLVFEYRHLILVVIALLAILALTLF